MKKIKKWGNSLAIRISKKDAELLGLHENKEVDVEVKKGVLVIKSGKESLESLVNQITKENAPSVEFPEDSAKGKEVW